jgi:DNA-binding transcriptional LysR family regulator
LRGLIRSLESALDVSLFDRSGRKALLTPAGEKILESARVVIDDARKLSHIASELAVGWEVELHVVVDGALPTEPLTACLKRFSEPDVPTGLRIDIEYQEGVDDRFHGGADIGLFIGFDYDGDEKGIDLIALPPLEMVLVVAADHALANRPVTEAMRAPHAEFVVRDSSLRYDARSRPSFIGSHNVVFLSEFHSKRVAMLAGAGYGWIPRHFVSADLANGALVLLQTESNSWTYKPQIGTRSGISLGRGAQLFVDTLTESLGS